MERNSFKVGYKSINTNYKHHFFDHKDHYNHYTEVLGGPMLPGIQDSCCRAAKADRSLESQEQQSPYILQCLIEWIFHW